MTIEKLIEQIEAVYGEYKNKSLKSVVISYIMKDIKDDQYKTLWNIILYFHKANFGNPCIATIEECIESARKLKGKMDIHKSKGTSEGRYNYMDDYLSGDEDLIPVGSLVDELAKKVKSE